MSARKPSWLRRFCPDGNHAQLSSAKCSCGVWVIVCSQRVEEKYDAGALSGDDLIVALLLRRQLTRITWSQALQQPTLVDMYSDIDAEGEYLAEHICGLAAISSNPPTMAKRQKTPHIELDVQPALISGFEWEVTT